jgi:osmotically-inducible protein OsmY
MKTNVALHDDVLAELMWDPRISEKEIGVAVKDGVVTLSGSVVSFTEKWEAERAAERVAGVKAVANEIAVKVPGTFQRTDTQVAHQAVESLAWNTQVPDERIQVSVTQGWITLSGDVDWQFQRNAAAAAVRTLIGVHGVSNDIKVVPKQVSSSDVSESIKAALERRADRTADHVVVRIKGSVVTLSGTVPSFGDRRAARGAAWEAPGVTDVRDELAVVL